MTLPDDAIEMRYLIPGDVVRFADPVDHTFQVVDVTREGDDLVIDVIGSCGTPTTIVGHWTGFLYLVEGALS